MGKAASKAARQRGERRRAAEELAAGGRREYGATSSGEEGARRRAEHPAVAAAARREWVDVEARMEAARAPAALVAETRGAAAGGAGGGGAGCSSGAAGEMARQSEREAVGGGRSAGARGRPGPQGAPPWAEWRRVSFSGAQSRMHGNADEYDAPFATLGPGGWADDDAAIGDVGYLDAAAVAAATRRWLSGGFLGDAASRV